MRDFDDIVLGAIGDIGRYGVQVTCVSGNAGGTPPFAYTAGLTAQGHPELILIGPIPPDLAITDLNDLAGRFFKHGMRLEAGNRLGDVLQGYDVIIAGPATEASGDRFPITTAKAVYGAGRAGRPLQVVYPDPGGRFPWESGCTLRQQPLICPVPPDRRRPA